MELKEKITIAKERECTHGKASFLICNQGLGFKASWISVYMHALEFH
jgi:hypothetical protein